MCSRLVYTFSSIRLNGFGLSLRSYTFVCGFYVVINMDLFAFSAYIHLLIPASFVEDDLSAPLYCFVQNQVPKVYRFIS